MLSEADSAAIDEDEGSCDVEGQEPTVDEVTARTRLPFTDAQLGESPARIFSAFRALEFLKASTIKHVKAPDSRRKGEKKKKLVTSNIFMNYKRLLVFMHVLHAAWSRVKSDVIREDLHLRNALTRVLFNALDNTLDKIMQPLLDVIQEGNMENFIENIPFYARMIYMTGRPNLSRVITY